MVVAILPFKRVYALYWLSYNDVIFLISNQFTSREEATIVVESNVVNAFEVV